MHDLFQLMLTHTMKWNCEWPGRSVNRNKKLYLLGPIAKFSSSGAPPRINVYGQDSRLKNTQMTHFMCQRFVLLWIRFARRGASLNVQCLPLEPVVATNLHHLFSLPPSGGIYGKLLIRNYNYTFRISRVLYKEA